MQLKHQFQKPYVGVHDPPLQPHALQPEPSAEPEGLRLVQREAVHMKVISGGGGGDADGNWYELPKVEREVPDDYLAKLLAVFRSPVPRQPSIMLVAPSVLSDLKDDQA